MFWSETMQLRCHGTSSLRLEPRAVSEADRRVERRQTVRSVSEVVSQCCVTHIEGCYDTRGRREALTVVFIITAGPQTHCWAQSTSSQRVRTEHLTFLWKAAVVLLMATKHICILKNAWIYLLDNTNSDKMWFILVHKHVLS